MLPSLAALSPGGPPPGSCSPRGGAARRHIRSSGLQQDKVYGLAWHPRPWVIRVYLPLRLTLCFLSLPFGLHSSPQKSSRASDDFPLSGKLLHAFPVWLTPTLPLSLSEGFPSPAPAEQIPSWNPTWHDVCLFFFWREGARVCVCVHVRMRKMGEGQREEAVREKERGRILSRLHAQRGARHGPEITT